MLLSTLLSAATVGFSAGVTPGPLQALLLSFAIKGGWKKALPAAFAPVVSDGPVILLVLLILQPRLGWLRPRPADRRRAVPALPGLGILPGLSQLQSRGRGAGEQRPADPAQGDRDEPALPRSLALLEPDQRAEPDRGLAGLALVGRGVPGGVLWRLRPNQCRPDRPVLVHAPDG